jgi:molybdenum cofactor cytidylyltransferase
VKTELILLAAGQSKRFGGIKQLANIYGQPMVCHCLLQYRQGEKWVEGITKATVVLGSNAELISQVLPDYVNKYVVHSWLNGMGHTLAQSIQNIASDTTHVLIGLADQIALTHQIISRLLDESNKYPQHIISAKYVGGLGAPVIFPKQYFYALSQLSGDKGAKILLQHHPQNIISLAIPEASLDIDTPEDFKLV